MTDPCFPHHLLPLIHRQYRLEWHGLHGAAHWARVLENGLHLCAATPGLRRDVVIHFALLHDACRHHDGDDPLHGPRAALFAEQLHHQGHLALDLEGLALLMEACRTHTQGRAPAHPTVMACWDSDRLDLPRIWNIEVNPNYLGTAAARAPETISWATEKARRGHFPWPDLFAQPGQQP